MHTRLRGRFVIGEVVAALRSVHDAGLVFGDLKPENIVITESGHVKLTDFGACRPFTEEAREALRGSRHAVRSLRDGDWRSKAGGEGKAEGGEEEEEEEEAVAVIVIVIVIVLVVLVSIRTCVFMACSRSLRPTSSCS
jgi:serine/threonine protein kinase